MTTSAIFPHAAALARLDAGDFAWLPAEYVDTQPKRGALHALLKASEAVHRAAVSTTQVADALRRDQKFVRPGPPSPHLVRLRQQQAQARQATNQARQAFIVAADELVRVFGLTVPQRKSLEAFAHDWIRPLSTLGSPVKVHSDPSFVGLSDPRVRKDVKEVASQFSVKGWVDLLKVGQETY